MAYRTELIDERRCRELRDRFTGDILFFAKADINGICIELQTADREHMDMWKDNFYAPSDMVRPHARVICVNDPGTDLHLEFEPNTFTAFLFNFDYYGWVKSIALGITGYILEAAHDIYSVHGAAINFDGTGVALIAPSKTGKTTQSWGLLRDVNSQLISDDWFFVTFGAGRPSIRGSEKNCYIDADIGDVWEQYKPLVKNVRFDNRGRGIANVRWAAGRTSVTLSASLRYVILLKRDQDDPVVSRELTAEEALEYLASHDLCNPHQIVRDEFRNTVRREFFRELFGRCRTFMVNTIKSAQDTQAEIRKIIGES
ncbi:MAG: hypothetical protein MJZ38_00765 [archaeon]|nr:hypothetical protein [archaeon]